MLALDALIRYIRETQKVDLTYINTLEYYTNELYLGLDVNTRRSLELCETLRTKEKRGTLLWVLDRTKTAMAQDYYTNGSSSHSYRSVRF